VNEPESVAPGWPGIQPRWTSSAKTGGGTALSPSSRVWFTLSHGILNEVYYPRLDQACIRDLGLIVTNGVDYFSEEKRHCAFSNLPLAPGIPVYELSNSEINGRYRIEKEVFTDPFRSERWTYATGTDVARQIGVEGYYVRIAPPEGDGAASPVEGFVPIKNRPAGQSAEPATHLISPDALALVRFGLRAPDDPRILNTLKVIDALLRVIATMVTAMGSTKTVPRLTDKGSAGRGHYWRVNGRTTN